MSILTAFFLGLFSGILLLIVAFLFVADIVVKRNGYKNLSEYWNDME